MRVAKMTEPVLSIKEIRERQENLNDFFSIYADNSELETLHKKLVAYLEKAEADISDNQDSEK